MLLVTCVQSINKTVSPVSLSGDSVGGASMNGNHLLPALTAKPGKKPYAYLNPSLLPKKRSKPDLKSLTVSASTTFSGRIFQLFTTLLPKENLPKFVLNL